jgi:hypothetical protein
MPIKAAPATTNMPLPPSSCAWRKPAGFPADKVAVGSAAQALDSSKADETRKGEMTVRTFMKLLRNPPLEKSEEAESVSRDKSSRRSRALSSRADCRDQTSDNIT